MSDDMILIRLQIFKDRRLKHRHCMKILRGDDGLFYHTDCASLHYWWKFMAFGNFALFSSTALNLSGGLSIEQN